MFEYNVIGIMNTPYSFTVKDAQIFTYKFFEVELNEGNPEIGFYSDSGICGQSGKMFKIICLSSMTVEHQKRINQLENKLDEFVMKYPNYSDNKILEKAFEKKMEEFEKKCAQTDLFMKIDGLVDSYFLGKKELTQADLVYKYGIHDKEAILNFEDFQTRYYRIMEHPIMCLLLLELSNKIDGFLEDENIKIELLEKINEIGDLGTNEEIFIKNHKNMKFLNLEQARNLNFEPTIDINSNKIKYSQSVLSTKIADFKINSNTILQPLSSIPEHNKQNTEGEKPDMPSNDLLAKRMEILEDDLSCKCEQSKVDSSENIRYQDFLRTLGFYVERVNEISKLSELKKKLLDNLKLIKEKVVEAKTINTISMDDITETTTLELGKTDSLFINYFNNEDKINFNMENCNEMIKVIENEKDMGFEQFINYESKLCHLFGFSGPNYIVKLGPKVHMFYQKSPFSIVFDNTTIPSIYPGYFTKTAMYAPSNLLKKISLNTNSTILNSDLNRKYFSNELLFRIKKKRRKDGLSLISWKRLLERIYN